MGQGGVYLLIGFFELESKSLGLFVLMKYDHNGHMFLMT